MKTPRLLAILALVAATPALYSQVSAERQANLTPDKVLEALVKGNERFAAGKSSAPDLTAQRAASVGSQHPKAVILSCLDSRVPVELVFDQGVGYIFVGRVAGNIEDTDQLGSMEFATKLSGAKLVMVLGHSRCGAVVGAINNAKLGNLTSLLAKIRPAVAATKGFKDGERTGDNAAFVEAVTEENVRQTVANIRKKSRILADMEKSGEIKIVGAMYDLKSGKVTVLD